MSKCIDPPELEEELLLAYINEQASKEVQAHLARCPHCAARADAYRRTRALLRATLYRHSCPAPEHLALYQLNLLPSAERLILAKHVRVCPHCKRELEELAREGDRPSLLERLRQAADVIEATLLPAPRLQVAPLRGALPELQCFRSKEVDIHLSVQPGHSRGTRTIMGRLVPLGKTASPTTDREVWLMHGDEAWVASVEDEGVFTFQGIEPGEYSIGLEWDGQAVLIREVRLE
jgi:anti-sigma factor RsiW